MVLLILLLYVPSVSEAQTTISDRRIEEKKRLSADAAPSHTLLRAPPFWIQAGGWANYRLISYRNLDKDSHTKDYYSFYRALDLRPWAQLVYQTSLMQQEGRVHYFYTRLKVAYVEQGGTAPGLKYDVNGPLFDYAYGSFDLHPWKIEAGRKYFSVGRGIAYGAVNDGASLSYALRDFQIGLEAARSLPHHPNIDTSVPGYDKASRRYFYGPTLSFTGFSDQYLYAYWLSERDHSREKPDDPDLDHRYNARYAGLGAHGDVTEHWSYWAEGIRENGHSYSSVTSEASAIAAWGFDGGAEYDTQSRLRFKGSSEYGFGSGDGERRSVTDTVGGNISGRDRGFLYFGYLPTGVAFSPMLANLHMARIGFSCYPFISSARFKGIELSADYFRYWKDQRTGGIDDTEATGTGRDVGHETDVRLDWHVSARVAWTFEAGVFTPGKAYTSPADDPETVLNAGVTIVF